MADDGKLTAELSRWEQSTVEQTAAPSGERRARFHTTSDIEIKRLYTPLDGANRDYLHDLGFPGEPPFTRGVQPTMYRARPWTVRQYSGFGSAADTNRRFHYLLQQGQTGLSAAFDLPTQMGYDSDDPAARGEVGKTGVAIDALDDMETLLAGLPLDRVSVSMTINAPAGILLAMYVAVAKKRGVALRALRGTIQNDVLKEYIARGTYIFPPDPSMRLIRDIFAYCAAELPNWNAISVSGYHMREAGCSAVQEVAFTLADGLAYVEAATTAGLNVDDFAGQLSFFFNCHNNFLEEIAKFRAARRLWARLMKDRCGAKRPKSMMLRFHTQTAGSMLTAQQPLTNVARVALQAMAAVLGGTQSLHANSFDEALALPSEAAATVALRTQQIIAEETGVADFIDPLAGSYAVEALTDEIEAGAAALLRRIDELGGMPAAIQAGWAQRQIQEKAYEWEKEINSGDRVIVGVNRYRQAESAAPNLHRPDPTVERDQVARLAAWRASRDHAAVRAARADVSRAAAGGDNLMPPILAAVEAHVTLGEIVRDLVKLWGRHQETVVV